MLAELGLPLAFQVIKKELMQRYATPRGDLVTGYSNIRRASRDNRLGVPR